MKSLLITIGTAIIFYFAYPAILGYASVLLSDTYAPGLFTAFVFFLLGGLYGYLISDSKYRLLLIVLKPLPILSILISASSYIPLTTKIYSDVLGTVINIWLSAFISATQLKK